MQNLLRFSEKLIERHSSLTFRREVVLLGRVYGMPVPQPSFAITSENAGTVQHQRIAAKLLLGVGVDLDEGPPCRRAPDVTLDEVRSHDSLRSATNCRSMV